MLHGYSKFTILLFLLLLILSFSVDVKSERNISPANQTPVQQAQKTAIPVAVEPSAESVKKNKSAAILANLKSLLNNVKEKKAELKQLSRELSRLSGELAKQKIKSVNELEKELEELELKLESVATGISVKAYRNTEPNKFVLAEEMEKLLQPLVYSMQSITQDSKEIETLKQNIENAEQKRELATEAIDNLNHLLTKVSDKTVKAALKSTLADWQKELENISNDHAIFTHQLEDKLQSKEPILSSTGALLTDFFKNRGVSLLLGATSFICVFFLMRFLYAVFKKVNARRKNKKQSTFERLTDLMYHVLTVLVSMLSILFVFNLRNDWLLLGVSIIFLVALGWILIKTLPTMVEQLMLLLNLGPVREGGRIVYNGVPWKVNTLHFYTHLINPDLSGGSLFLPVRQLVGLVSRPAAKNEEWFPTNEGDWVKIDDTTIGEVIYQSPEMVQMRLFGGNLLNFTTENYLAMNPMNLSKGYRIQMVFGIDYKYQAECTTSVPKKMTEKFRQDLIPVVGEENLRRVIVDFFLPNNSSLDFEYEVFLTGAVAHLYEEVERTMIYSFADVCNENHWEIPFQQITLHQSKA